MVSLALTRAFAQQGPPQPASDQEEQERYRYLQLKAKAAQGTQKQTAPNAPAPPGQQWEVRDPLSPTGDPNDLVLRDIQKSLPPIEKQPDAPWNEQLADILDRGADSLVGMVRGQGGRDSIREGLMVPMTEGMARLPSLALRDPKAAFEAVEPTHMASRAYADYSSGVRNALKGDWQGAAEDAITGTTEGLGAALTVGGVRAGTPKGPPSAKSSIRETGKTLATVVSKEPIRPQAMQAINRILVHSGIPADRIASGLGRVIDLAKEANGRALTVAQLLQREFAPEFPQIVDNINTVLRERSLSRKPKDASPTIVRETTQGMRATQSPFLTQSATENLGAGSRPATREQVSSDLKKLGRTGYDPLLEQAASPDTAHALTYVMRGPGMEDLMGPLRKIAAGKGIDIDTMIAQNPTEAAHWMQHQARIISESAAAKGDKVEAGAYGDMRDRLLTVLDELQTPAGVNYKEVREQYRDTAAIDTALDEGNNFGTKVLNPEGAADFLADFAKKTPAQQSATLQSIGDWVHQVLRGGPQDAPARISRLMQQGVIDTLEQLGPRGQKLADDIRAIRGENEFLGATTNRGQSATMPNALAMQEGPNIYSRGGASAGAVNALADAGMMMTGLSSIPILTALREGPKMYSSLMQPKRRTREDMTRVLMSKQPDNPLSGAMKPPPPQPSGPPKLSVVPSEPKPSGPKGSAPYKPTSDELRISETINEQRNRGVGDAEISDHLAMYGINIKPERIDYFAKMTPAKPARVTSPDRVDDMAAKGARVYEMRGVGLSDREIARDLGLDPGSPPSQLKRLFDNYLRAFESGKKGSPAIEGPPGQLSEAARTKQAMDFINMSAIEQRAFAEKAGVRWMGNYDEMRNEVLLKIMGIVARDTPLPTQAPMKNITPKGPRPEPEGPPKLSFDKSPEPKPSTPLVGGRANEPPPLTAGEGARLARAKEQGFDVDVPLYHGTGRDFGDFKVGGGGRPQSMEPDAREGIFLTTNPKIASEYASEAAYRTAGEGANVRPVYARLKNPLVIDNYSDAGNNPTYAQVLKRAKAAGHDGVIFRGNDHALKSDGARGGDTYVIFDAANVKGKFDKFDSPRTAGEGSGPPAATAPKGPPRNALRDEPRQRFNTRASIKDAPREYRDAVMTAPEGVSQAQWDAIRKSTGSRLPSPYLLGNRIAALERKPGGISQQEIRELKALKEMKRRLDALNLDYE